ncbi:MAG: alpha/beta fold hydrolase [Nannocystales bacterium]
MIRSKEKTGRTAPGPAGLVTRWCGAGLPTLCVCTAVACAGPPTEVEPSTGGAVPVVVDEACPGTVPGVSLRCGRLEVPQDWDDAESLRLELPFIVLEAESLGAAMSDPILYLGGGPGPSGLEGLAELSTLTELRASRDIVILEYRGSGVSNPALPCARVSSLDSETLGDCWDRAFEAGLDPTYFTTKNAAMDRRALRIGLGIQQWNLWGASYGTTVAQLLSKIDEDGTRSVTLDSPTSPAVEIARADLESRLDALTRVFSACYADSACADGIGDLQSLLTETFRALNTEPWRHESLALTEAAGPVIDGHEFLRLVTSIHHTLVPAVVHRVGSKDPEGLGAVLDATPPPPRSPPYLRGFPAYEELSNLSFSASVYCAEEAPSYDLDRRPPRTLAAWPDDIIASPSIHTTWEFCRNWPVPAVPSEDVALVRNELPTLILAGEFDSLTPAQQGRVVAEGLPNSTLVEVPNTGHGVVATQRCGEELMAQFLEDPRASLDRTCIDEIPPTRFVRTRP